MSSINFPGADAVAKEASAYALDLVERVLSTFVVAAGGVMVSAGPLDMFHASFWQAVGVAGLAAGGSVVKGVWARLRGDKNSASLIKGV